MLRYTTDRARTGLDVLYDIRPGNGAGQFLQPRSPHGAIVVIVVVAVTVVTVVIVVIVVTVVVVAAEVVVVVAHVTRD